MNRVRLWGRRLAAFYRFLAATLLGTVLLFAAIELSTRLLLPGVEPLAIDARTLVADGGVAPTMRSHPFAAFEWIPNARVIRQTVGPDGFVSTPAVSIEKPEREIRIVTLGGSSTVGNGNRDEETYPRRLEALLRDRGLSCRVINAAVGGYTTRESLGLFQSRLLLYDPDIVLVMHGWNDLYYFTKTDEELSRWREKLNLAAMWDPSARRTAPDPEPRLWRYLGWSQFLLHLRDATMRHTVPRGAGTVEARFEGVTKRSDGTLQVALKPVNPKALDLYAIDLEQLKNLCRLRSIACYAILQPTLLLPKREMKMPKLMRAVQSAVVYHRLSYDRHVQLFEKIYETEIRLFGEERIIDARSLSGNEELFFDHIHLSAEGCRRLAGLVAARLLRQDPSQHEASRSKSH